MPKYHIVRKIPADVAGTDEALYMCHVSHTGFWKALYFIYLVIINRAAFSMIVTESFLLEDCTPVERKEFLENAFK